MSKREISFLASLPWVGDDYDLFCELSFDMDFDDTEKLTTEEKRQLQKDIESDKGKTCIFI